MGDKKHIALNQNMIYLLIILALMGSFFGSIYLVRSFLYDWYSIPGASMSPTININNLVVVNKHIYIGAAKGSPEATRPQRGDIIAFKSPQSPTITYLKRVIGIPGDVVSFTDKQLSINGKLVKTQKVDGFTFSENLEGIIYQVQYLNEENPYRTLETVVPDNHYFVMGDNRDNSADSRMWGFVPAENLVGKLVMIW